MINPAKLMKMKGVWEQFQKRHPKFVRYLQVVTNGAIQEDSVIEMVVRDPQGQELKTNMRVTAEDMQLYDTLRELLQNEKN